LIGSMNPEEGRLRPQILDRFGLRVTVRGLLDSGERMEVYKRMREYARNPTAFIQQWEYDTSGALDEVIAARERLKTTVITDEALRVGFELVRRLDIDSHRADYTMFEAARAYAAADGRQQADVDDVRAVAPLALRQRRSEFMVNHAEEQQEEDEQIRSTFDAILV
jgi:magnesium chelatase subunit I